MSKKEKMSFEDKMKLKAKKAFKNSRYGWIGGIKGRLLIFIGTFILPIMFSLFLFTAVMVVLSGGIVAILEIDPDLKVSEKPVEENEGGGDLSNRVIDIPDEFIGKMFFPVGNKISSHHQRNRTYAGKTRDHLGTDFAGGFTMANAPEVFPIYPGKVTIAGPKSTLGNVVVLEHESGGEKIYSLYAHLSKIYVKKGDVLGYNDKVGRMGKTGGDYAVHLHLEIHTDKLPASGYGNWATTLEPLDILQCTETTKISRSTRIPPEIPITHCMNYRKKATSGLQ